MLIISQNGTAAALRRKYTPRKVSRQWVVLEAGETSSRRVYGPESLHACQLFIERAAGRR